MPIEYVMKFAKLGLETDLALRCAVPGTGVGCFGNAETEEVMIEVLLDCSRCKKLSRCEREGRVDDKPVCGHGTIITPSKVPNFLQCSCGNYLDDRHLAKEH